MITISRLAPVSCSRLRASLQQASRPPDMVLANDRLELTIQGDRRHVLQTDAARRRAAQSARTMGHFLALDGFGAPSEQERAAGMPFHGEASKQLGEDHRVAEFRARCARSSSRRVLPLAQETLTRTVEIVDGENVVYVTSDLESGDRRGPAGLLGRARHDRSSVSREGEDRGGYARAELPRPAVQARGRFRAAGVRTRFPVAHGAHARTDGQADLRARSRGPQLSGPGSCQMDPKRKLAFVTALHLDKHLLFGYVFRRQDYPWLMSWMNYTGDNRAARGMEFSTQPFDVSHQETVAMSPLFGTPTFRWLPAKVEAADALSDVLREGSRRLHPHRRRRARRRKADHRRSLGTAAGAAGLAGTMRR